MKQTNNKHTAISYEDILLKMGMYVSDGKLHTYSSAVTHNNVKESIPTPQNANHKHLNLPTLVSEPRKPKTIHEYKTMILQKYIQRQKMRQIKSNKIIIPRRNEEQAVEPQNTDRLLFYFTAGCK
jgi:hypothetical protein